MMQLEHTVETVRWKWKQPYQNQAFAIVIFANASAKTQNHFAYKIVLFMSVVYYELMAHK